MTDGMRCLVTLRWNSPSSDVVSTAKATTAMNRRNRMFSFSLRKQIECEFKEFGLKACRLVSFQLIRPFLSPNLPIKAVLAQHSWPFWLTAELKPVRWRTGLEMFKGDLREKVRRMSVKEKKGDEKGVFSNWPTENQMTNIKKLTHDGWRPLRNKVVYKGDVLSVDRLQRLHLNMVSSPKYTHNETNVWSSSTQEVKGRPGKALE